MKNFWPRLFLKIGGPTFHNNKTTPFTKPIESFLGWFLCVSCLSVSGYHYYVSNYIRPFVSKWKSNLKMMTMMMISCDSSSSSSSSSNMTMCTTLLSSSSSNSTSNNFNGSSKEKASPSSSSKNHQETIISSFLTCWIPLTTYSKSEIRRKSPLERHHELIQMIYYFLFTTGKLCIPEASTASSVARETARDAATATLASNGNHDMNLIMKHIDDDLLVTIIRENIICRRLVSLAMRPYRVEELSSHCSCNNDDNDYDKETMTEMNHITSKTTTSSSSSSSSSQLILSHPHLILIQRLVKLWPRLLELPELHTLPFKFDGVDNDDDDDMSDNKKDTFNISVIVPSYKETASYFQTQLNHLLRTCSSPQWVEVIIVDAGGGHDDSSSTRSLTNLLKTMDDAWGSIKILPFIHGGGRGPCMNYGAEYATGSILMFCHLDTKVPIDWDIKICETLHCENRKKGQNHYGMSQLSRITRANSCAFSFGIDTSKEGLSTPFAPDVVGYFPPGIKAVETTANIRTQLFSLPYGDQVISIPRNIFHFLGGYPDQCLMEDYELVSLLRRRAAHIKTPHPERLKIIQGKPALCSPRRWQRFGVLYVTYMNSKLVNLYAGGMDPEEIFFRYYGGRPPERSNKLSPWEIEMNRMLQSEESNQ